MEFTEGPGPGILESFSVLVVEAVDSLFVVLESVLLGLVVLELIPVYLLSELAHKL